MNTPRAFAHEAIEHASVDELRSLQLKRLQSTLHHAYANSPVYKAKFDAAGVHPSDCKSLTAPPYSYHSLLMLVTDYSLVGTY